MQEFDYNIVASKDVMIDGKAHRKGDVVGKSHIMEREAENFNVMNAGQHGNGLKCVKVEKETTIQSMKKDELVKYIQEKGYEIDTNQNKGELIAAIEEAEKQ